MCQCEIARQRDLRKPHAIRLNEDTLFVLDHPKIEMFSLVGQYQGKIDLKDCFSNFYFEIGKDQEIVICDIEMQINILNSKGKVIYCDKENRKADRPHTCLLKQTRSHFVTFRTE